MLLATIEYIRCTSNHPSESKLFECIELEIYTKRGRDIIKGTLKCPECQNEYPIIKGVLILTENLYDYFNRYINGISAFSNLEDVPEKFKKYYLLAKENLRYNQNISPEKWQVNSWYIINNFFSKRNILDFIKLEPPSSSLSFQKLANKYWSKGPLSQLQQSIIKGKIYDACIDLGCNVGGAIRIIHKQCNISLGTDISFSAIQTARTIFHSPSNFFHQFSNDSLFEGINIKLQLDIDEYKHVDFFVSDIRNIPLPENKFDLIISMNVMDMIDDPEDYLIRCKQIMKKKATIYHCCPYTWTDKTAKTLKAKIPQNINNSSLAIEWLFKETGFLIHKTAYDLPWLFLKHNRQLVFYSLHSIIGQSPLIF